MISAGLDIESEGFLLMSAVEGPLPIQKRIKKYQKLDEYIPNIICERCGMIGHLSTQCKTTEEMITQYGKEFNQEIVDYTAKHINENRDFYCFDEFGPYIDVDEEKFHTNETFANSCICLNCGKPGHQWIHCNHIPFYDIFRKMSDEELNDPNKFSEKYLELWNEYIQ